jgi:hypothetical protein
MKKVTTISLTSIIGRRVNLMKTFLVICFMTIAVVSKAQDSMIGKSYGDINTEMLALRNTNINTGETTIAGQYQATYKVGERFYYSFLFNKADNICTGFKEIMGNDMLVAAKDKLNQEYIKTDDTHWVSKDKIYKIAIDFGTNDVTIIHLKAK